MSWRAMLIQAGVTLAVIVLVTMVQRQIPTVADVVSGEPII